MLEGHFPAVGRPRGKSGECWRQPGACISLVLTHTDNAYQATVYFDQLAETQLPVSKHGISIRLQTAHQYVIQLDQLHVKVI